MSQLYTDSESYIPSDDFETETHFSLIYEPDRLYLVDYITQETLERFLYLLSSVTVYTPEELVLGQDKVLLLGLVASAPSGINGDYEYESEVHKILLHILQELKIYRGEAAYFVSFDTMVRSADKKHVKVHAGIKRTHIQSSQVALAGEKQEYKRMKLPEVQR